MTITEAITSFSNKALEKAQSGADGKSIARHITQETSKVFRDRDERRAVLYGVRETCYYEHGLDLAL